MQEIEKITSKKVWIKDCQNKDGEDIENYDKCSLKYVLKTDNSIFTIAEHFFNYNQISHYVVNIGGSGFLIKKTDLEFLYNLSYGK